MQANELLSDFIQHYQQHAWANEAKTVLLTVSGGMDSMVMATLFAQSKISFAVAHCNFQLRGEEADADEKLVQDWCAQHAIPFYVNRFDTRQYSTTWKMGIQETARKLRYDWFATLRQQQGFSFIATAHHRDDSIETVLMNLFKGTGIRGLAGIPVQNGAIIRPLLFASRERIRQFAQAHQVPFREDSSNTDDKYLRNAVRHHLIPTIQNQFPQATDRLQESVSRFSQAADIYEKGVAEILKKLVEKRGNDTYIPVRKLLLQKPLETIVYELFRPYQFTTAQTAQLIALLQAPSGKHVASATHKVIKDRDFLIVTAAPPATGDFYTIDAIPCSLTTDTLSFRFSQSNMPTDITADKNSACIDAAQLVFPLILRRWRMGDYFYPLGMGMKKKKLSRYLIDVKMPIHLKEQLWVLESNKRIVWVVGQRLDERFRITEKTTTVLKVEARLQ